jgi:hypothetical protein
MPMLPAGWKYDESEKKVKNRYGDFIWHDTHKSEWRLWTYDGVHLGPYRNLREAIDAAEKRTVAVFASVR